MSPEEAAVVAQGTGVGPYLQHGLGPEVLPFTSWSSSRCIQSPRTSSGCVWILTQGRNNFGEFWQSAFDSDLAEDLQSGVRCIRPDMGPVHPGAFLLSGLEALHHSSGLQMAPGRCC